MILRGSLIGSGAYHDCGYFVGRFAVSKGSISLRIPREDCLSFCLHFVLADIFYAIFPPLQYPRRAKQCLEAGIENLCEGFSREAFPFSGTHLLEFFLSRTYLDVVSSCDFF